MSTLKSPAGIQVQSVTSKPSSPNGSACWTRGHDDRQGDQPGSTMIADRHDLRGPAAEPDLEPAAEQRGEREAEDRQQER